MTVHPYQGMIDGHELAMRQVARHGVDRYRSEAEQAAKVLIEAGELALAIAVHEQQHHGAHDIDQCPGVRSELADTGLSLYLLASKLGLGLIACMDELVENDGRRFR